MLSLDMHIQTQPILRYRHFTNKDESFGSNVGDTLLFNKFFNVQTAGGQLSELGDFPETQIKTRQSQCIATEWGNSIPFTEKLLRLSKFDTQDVLQRAIINDMAKVMDRAVYNEFAATKIYYTPTGATSKQYSNTGAAGTTATDDIKTWDLVQLSEGLQSGIYSDGTRVYNSSPVPPYDDDGNYILIIGVGASTAIRLDARFIDGALYGDPDRLFAGEIGQWHGFRVIVENNVLGLFFTLGTTKKGPGFAFGADPVKEISVLPEEIRLGVPLGGGRKRAMYWYGISGFKVMWEFSGTNGAAQSANAEPMNTIIAIQG